MPITIQAEEIEYITSNSSKSIVENIDRVFIQKPQKRSVLLTPKIKGKSRYSFSIQRDAYYLSKKHADSSDLFYLSQQIDSGLKFQSNKSKNIDIVISKINEVKLDNDIYLQVKGRRKLANYIKPKENVIQAQVLVQDREQPLVVINFEDYVEYIKLKNA